MFTDYVCPHCGNPLLYNGKSYSCARSHLFDAASSGYVNLLPVNKKNSVQPGDNPEMTRARVEVMKNGYYNNLAAEIASVCHLYDKARVLDAGCGVGYLSHKFNEYYPESIVLGADISKFAINAAAKLYKNVSFCVAASKDLPLPDGWADIIICAFAPVFESEFSRVLKSGGILIRVIPGADHLFSLKAKLYPTPLPNERENDSLLGFDLLQTAFSRHSFTASGAEITSLVQMTPYYYHAPQAAVAALGGLSQLTVNTEFEIRLYRKSGQI